MQGPGHIWEGKKQKRAATKCIDSPERGKSEEEVDRAEAKRGNQRVEIRGPCIFEDGGRVKGNDIDAVGDGVS